MNAGIGQTHSFSVDIYPNSTPSILGLFSVCRPSAIIRGVSAFVIYTLNRIAAFWFRPHIVKECRKIHPSFTNSNPPATILGIFWSGWIKTPPKHRYPTSILARVAASDSMTMLSMRLLPTLSSKAPAAFGKPSSQAARSDNYINSTVALAQPSNRTSKRNFAAKDYEPTESFASPVGESSHSTSVTYASRMGHCPYCGKMVNQKTAHQHWLTCPKKRTR